MSSSQKVYTVAIAGLGRRGIHHAQAFSGNPRFEVVGLCDLDEERMQAAADQFGTAYTNTDAAQMLADTQADIFTFCTLPSVRLPLIRVGVEAGVKLIAFEKPMAMSTNEALAIMELLRGAGVKAVVSHQHRYGEHYKKVKEIIESGAIGRVHTIYGHATAWMLHLITHLIDYIRWYNDNADAEWVVGQAAGKEKFEDVHPSPDYIAGLIQFENGVRGIVECGEGAPDVPEVDYWWRKCRVSAQGTEGFAEVLTGGGWRALTRDSGGMISGGGNMDYDHDMPPYVQQIADWLDDDEQLHPCNGESAFKGLEIMMAICRSVVQRGKVTLPLEPGDPELESLEDALP
jgi:predicted dehydrogenase